MMLGRLMRTTEPLVPKSSVFWFRGGYWKTKRLKNPVIDQILEEIIKAGSRTIRSEIYNRYTESSIEICFY
jgi:hypothetical protein